MLSRTFWKTLQSLATNSDCAQDVFAASAAGGAPRSLIGYGRVDCGVNHGPLPPPPPPLSVKPRPRFILSNRRADEMMSAVDSSAAGSTLLPRSWPMPSRRRNCHSADIPSPSLLKNLLKGEGGAAE